MNYDISADRDEVQLRFAAVEDRLDKIRRHKASPHEELADAEANGRTKHIREIHEDLAQCDAIIDDLNTLYQELEDMLSSWDEHTEGLPRRLKAEA